MQVSVRGQMLSVKYCVLAPEAAAPAPAPLTTTRRQHRRTCLRLAVVALPLSVGAQREAELVRVVGEGLARRVGAVVGGAAVLALVGRAGVGHLHLVAPLGQRLVGLAVHLLHGWRRWWGGEGVGGARGWGVALLGPASVAQHKHSTATARSTESGRRGSKRGGKEGEEG